ncbi:paeninodin family lasso peptide [Paenibacillus polymyxa]|nr:paeninodin family lasso peptide [Paenibacillus polymyxa]
MSKKEWQEPTIEVLDINQTKAGKGWKQIDWVSDHDADLYNPS